MGYIPPNEEEFEEAIQVIHKMKTYGGSFVKILGDLFDRADRQNFYRLKETFKEYWDEYKSKGN